MLIYLTNSLIVDSQDSCYNNIRIAIRNIAWAVIESKHILRGDYEVLCQMRDIFQSDIDIFPLFKKLSLDYSTHTLPDTIHHYVEVVKESPNNREYNGSFIKQVTYEYFLDSLKVQPMNFIIEDEDDDIMYNLIINWYIKEKRINTNISYIVVHGGGGNIVDVARRYIREGIMAVCITDPDLHYPEQEIEHDSSCAKCARLYAIEGIYYHYYPQVHEIENLIPLNYIDGLDWHLKQNELDKRAFDKLRDCASCERILQFFDYKSGIKKGLIEEANRKTEYYEYAKLCCEQNKELLEGQDFDEYYQKLGNKDYVYPRLRNRIMPDLKKLFAETLPEPNLMNFQKEEWEKMGYLLVDLFCARNKEPML